MINSLLPSWKQLLGKINYDVGQAAYWGSKDIVYTCSSEISLALIFSAFRHITKSDKVDVYVPEFFFADIRRKIENARIQFHTYEVRNDFEPDWKKIQEKKKEKIDIFLFCHFFGVYHDIGRAKNFCAPRDIILIEDCTYVLYPASTYGKVGDFVIFSPYNVLPVPDGGILIKNKSKIKTVEAIYDLVAKKCDDSMPDRKFVWRVKKAIQKIVSVQGKNICKPQSRKKHRNKVLNNKISSYAFQLIQGVSYKEFKRMAYVRRCNVQVMNYLVKQIDNSAFAVIMPNVECPYTAAYLLKDVYHKNKVAKELRRLGITYFCPFDSRKKTGSINWHLTEKDKSRNLISIPIHQGIRPQQIAKQVSIKKAKQNTFWLEWLENSEKGKEKYQNVNSRIEFGNIPQEWDYGDVKGRAESWKAERAIIKDQDGYAVGIVQMLKKRKGMITIFVRVNRGPLLISDYDNIENKLMVMELIRKKVPHPIPIIYAPNIEFTGENLAFATSYGWKQWNLFGFSSGMIDLQAEQGDIRKSFEKHWRNRLAYAERDNPEIKTDLNRFEEILDLYEQSQTEKHFVGIPRNVLQGLLHLKDSPLQLMYLTNKEDEIIAFDIFYMTNNFGLYLVGWNGSEGRKRYLNNLLFYNAAKKFRERGIRWLDLGGIDYIETEENARFKDGMRPQHYQLLGEFIKF